MLDVKVRGILLNIFKDCERILDKVSNIDLDSFLDNEDSKEIVCFNLFQIGELAKKLDQDFVNEYNKVPWSNIKGMRDIIIHSYGSINMKRVYYTATLDIGPLKDYLETILNSDAEIKSNI